MVNSPNLPTNHRQFPNLPTNHRQFPERPLHFPERPLHFTQENSNSSIRVIREQPFNTGEVGAEQFEGWNFVLDQGQGGGVELLFRP